MEQVFYWRGYAHFVWVATWYSSRPARLAERILKDYGIGHLEMRVGSFDINDPDEALAPALLRRPPNLELLTQKLVPQQKTAVAAGGNRGGHWTPFVTAGAAHRQGDAGIHSGARYLQTPLQQHQKRHESATGVDRQGQGPRRAARQERREGEAGSRARKGSRIILVDAGKVGLYHPYTNP
jgi:hypothetical protein